MLVPLNQEFERLMTVALKRHPGEFLKKPDGSYENTVTESLWQGFKLYHQAVAGHIDDLVNVPVSGESLVEKKLEPACSCRYSDSWRCAKDRGLRTIHCSCDCHKRRAGV